MDFGDQKNANKDNRKSVQTNECDENGNSANGGPFNPFNNDKNQALMDGDYKDPTNICLEFKRHSLQ